MATSIRRSIPQHQRFTPSLPQRCTDRDSRSRALERARGEYQYSVAEENPIHPIAIAGRKPLSQNYGLTWALPYLPQLARSLRGAVTGYLRSLWSIGDKETILKGLFRDAGLHTPDAVADHAGDAPFARNWLDGTHPLMLQRVADAGELRRRIHFDDAEWRTALAGLPPAHRLVEDHRLFIVDYELLRSVLLQADLAGRDSRWREKYLPAPVVLLAELPGVDPACDLVPLAIQIDQAGARGANPIYWRSDGPAWRLAKVYVSVADFNVQAMSSHIFRHHYIAEPFVVSTHRQLHPAHPLFVLLEPHLAYTLAVNHAALGLLKRRGSVFDQIYAGRLEETRQIMVASHRRWDWQRLRLHADLDARGVSAHPLDYPFRDDARLWPPVLHRFVRSYLEQFYARDADVAADAELQAWFAELQSPTGGNLRGLTDSGRLDSLEELARLLAEFLFIAGPGHAALHYPQTDYFTYAPAHPGAAYLPPPDAGETIDETRIRSTLPPVSRGVAQFLNNQIAYYRFDRFGDYRRYRLSRVEPARSAIERLQADLAELERTIDERNRHRRRAYRYLAPSLVPNSINI